MEDTTVFVLSRYLRRKSHGMNRNEKLKMVDDHLDHFREYAEKELYRRRASADFAENWVKFNLQSSTVIWQRADLITGATSIVRSDSEAVCVIYDFEIENDAYHDWVRPRPTVVYQREFMIPLVKDDDGFERAMSGV